MEEQLIIFSSPLNCTPEGSRWWIKSNKILQQTWQTEKANEGWKMDAHFYASHGIFFLLLLIRWRRLVEQHHLFLTAHCAAFTIPQLNGNKLYVSHWLSEMVSFVWLDYFLSSSEESLGGIAVCRMLCDMLILWGTIEDEAYAENYGWMVGLHGFTCSWFLNGWMKRWYEMKDKEREREGEGIEQGRESVGFADTLSLLKLLSSVSVYLFIHYNPLTALSHKRTHR